jgi:hypothetical protein
MHPETMTAIIEVRVIEGMTKEDVTNELRSALLTEAGLPTLPAFGCGSLADLAEALVRAYTIS